MEPKGNRNQKIHEQWRPNDRKITGCECWETAIEFIHSSRYLLSVFDAKAIVLGHKDHVAKDKAPVLWRKQIINIMSVDSILMPLHMRYLHVSKKTSKEVKDISKCHKGDGYPWDFFCSPVFFLRLSWFIFRRKNTRSCSRSDLEETMVCPRVCKGQALPKQDHFLTNFTSWETENH